MNKALFYKLDTFMPRWLAIAPYAIALMVVRLLLKASFGLETKVWARNSTRSKTFIFGVSDLDLTAVVKPHANREIFSLALSIGKSLFKFLGECHFYSKQHFSWLLAHANRFELLRDPSLIENTKFPLPENDSIEKFIFLQRMLFSDVLTLKENPIYRQAKWKHHFALLGIQVEEKMITTQVVRQKIIELIGEDPLITSGLDSWLLHIGKKDFDVYHEKLGEGFRVLAPHLHLWYFNENGDDDFLDRLSPIHKKIIKRQIDWEIWGLYTQRHCMSPDQSIKHLSRLILVYGHLAPEINIAEMSQKIKEAILG